MLKRLIIVIVFSVFSIATIAPLAGMSSATPMNKPATVVKSLNAANKAPVILLAANDVALLQDIPVESTRTNNLSVKQTAPVETTNVLSDIPAQAWLILAALCCFVMRSSRRVV